ncbi:unnamed protein product, partial [marine sediment metagenome]
MMDNWKCLDAHASDVENCVWIDFPVDNFERYCSF